MAPPVTRRDGTHLKTKKTWLMNFLLFVIVVLSLSRREKVVWQPGETGIFLLIKRRQK